MSRIKGKFVKNRKKYLGNASIRYYKGTDSFSIRLKNGRKIIKVSREDLYLLVSFRSEATVEKEVDNLEFANLNISFEDYEFISLIQHLFVLNWKVVCDVIKQEHRVRLGRTETCWVELERRSVSYGHGRPSLKEHGGVTKEEYEEATDNVYVALKYKDQAWFVEYCRRICLYEKREFNVDKIIRYFNLKSF